jgi:hypothetical protein
MVSKRLHWHLEYHKLVNPLQSGFTVKRSAIDNLVIYESDLKLAKQRAERTCTVFFDLEKAFDKAWHRLILSTAIEKGLTGNIYHFMDNFLKNRSFQILLGNKLSDQKRQLNGVPQGSVLSTTLFKLLMENIYKHADTTHIQSARHDNR